MSSYDSATARFKRDMPPANPGVYQNYLSSSPPQAQQDLMLQFPASQNNILQSSSLDTINFQNAVNQPNQSASQPLNHGNQFYFPQESSISNNSGFLSPSDNGFGQSPQSIQGAYSPTAMNGAFADDGFVSTQFTSGSQFEAAALEQALAQSHLHSPLVGPDFSLDSFDLQNYSTAINMNTGSTLYAPATPQSAGHSPNLLPQQATNLQQPGAYSIEGRPSPLSLTVPLFGNNIYPSGNASNTIMTNAANQDYAIPPHMRSPIVRIQNCADAPTPPGLSRNLSRRSQSSKISNNMLSPYGDDDFEEHGWSSQDERSLSPNRHDDGSWISDEYGMGGVSPIDRQSLNSLAISSLDDQEKQRLIAKKNAEVASWQVSSANASENEDQKDPVRRSRRRNRPRARSTNDIAAAHNQQIGMGYLLVPQPGPGVVVNEVSDLDEDVEANDEASSYSDSDFEPPSPPMDDEIFSSQTDYFAATTRSADQSWTETEIEPPTAKNNTERFEPTTASAAMAAYSTEFGANKKDVDNASVAATIGTIGSRRRSVSDMDSMVSQPGISRKVSNDLGSKLKKTLFSRRTPSLSNHKKRKSNASSTQLPSVIVPDASAPTPINQRNMSGLMGRPRTPKLDTNIASVSVGARSPIMAGLAAVNNKFRNRSKSDIGRSRSPSSLGIVGLWQKTGGPPVPMLASPAHSFIHQQQQFPAQPRTRAVGVESDDEADGEHGVSMDLSVRLDMNVIPTIDGFQRQISTLNPHVDPKILDRLIQEQQKRYRRLVDIKIEHQKAVMKGKCPSGNFCFALGGAAQIIQPKPTGKSDSAPVVFQIIPAGTSIEQQELHGDNQAAQFPHGIPLPPVKSLPAKFECPYCFKVKEFKKPSDWTKHVHEDVQPFTCTFPDCIDSKSFKRKADWVRHESEKHRQLESWTCSFEECAHVCYRRDNFVQHLVREHRIPEPKIRTGRNSGARSPARSPYTPVDFGYGPVILRSDEEVNEKVNHHVESCRGESDKDAGNEPCRFCGNICTNFKKLTVHLAKHMEQIAMPVIPLIVQHPGVREVNKSFQQQSRVNANTLMTAAPMISVTEQPTFFFEEPEGMEMPAIAINGAPPPPQYTYPPASFAGNQLLDVDSTYALNMMGTSFPPAMVPGRSRSSSFNEAYVIPRQDATFPPANLMPRTQYSPSQTPIIVGTDFDSQFTSQHTQYFTGSMPYNGQ